MLVSSRNKTDGPAPSGLDITARASKSHRASFPRCNPRTSISRGHGKLLVGEIEIDSTKDHPTGKISTYSSKAKGTRTTSISGHSRIDNQVMFGRHSENERNVVEGQVRRLNLRRFRQFGLFRNFSPSELKGNVASTLNNEGVFRVVAN